MSSKLVIWDAERLHGLHLQDDLQQQVAVFAECCGDEESEQSADPGNFSQVLQEIPQMDVVWDEELLSEHDAYNVWEEMPLKDSVSAHEVIWDEEPQQLDGEMGESLTENASVMENSHSYTGETVINWEDLDDKNTKDSAPVLLDGMSSQEVVHRVCDERLGKVRWDLLQQPACGREYPDDNKKLIMDERHIGENPKCIFNLHSNIRRPLDWCGEFCDGVNSNQVAESSKESVGVGELHNLGIASRTAGAYVNGSLPLQFSASTSDLGGILAKQVSGKVQWDGEQLPDQVAEIVGKMEQVVPNRGKLDGTAVSLELGIYSPFSLQAGTSYTDELSIGGCMCFSIVKSANQVRLLMEKEAGGTMAVEEGLIAVKVEWSLNVLFSQHFKLAWLDPNHKIASSFRRQ